MEPLKQMNKSKQASIEIAQALAAQGKSISEIARERGSTFKTIARYLAQPLPKKENTFGFTGCDEEDGFKKRLSLRIAIAEAETELERMKQNLKELL